MAQSTSGFGRWMRWALHLVPAVAFMSGAYVAGCSCEEDTGDFALASDPRLLVTPESITFSAASPDMPEQRSVLISNVGSGKLTDFTYRLQKNEGPFTLILPSVNTLSDDESMQLDITYRPDDGSADDDVLIIEASNSQRAEVILSSVPPRRDLQCDPATITFTGADLGGQATAEVEVVNIGTLPVTITGFDMEDGFEVSITEEPELEVVLAPQEKTSLTMAFTPFGGGMSTDRLRIITDEAPGLFTCDVRANTPLPHIVISPDRVDFGALPSGESTTADITISNEGAATLEISPPAFLRDNSPDITFVDPPAENVQIEPGDSFVLTAQYTAGAVDATSTAVLVNNDLTNPQAVIPMLGRPLRPDLIVSPDSLNFGAVGQGVTTTRTLTLINNGTQDLNVTSMVINGTTEISMEPNNSFPPTTGGGAGVIAAGDAVEVRVTYGPTDLGQDTATMLIESNDPDEPIVEVPMLGTGLERGECEIAIRPDPLNFGLVARGGEKILSANVENRGGGYCTYRNATVTGILNTAFTLQSSSVPRNGRIEPGQTLLLEVKYNPTTSDINFGKLTVDVIDEVTSAPVFCNAGLRCQEDPNRFECGFMPPVCGVDIQGTAGISDIAVIPGNVDFGLVTLGCSSQVTTITVYNTGVADLGILDVRLSDECSDEFQLRGTPGPPYPVPVDRNQPIPIQVIYTPQDLGPDQCSLIIESDAVESEPELHVPLRGEGTNVSHQIDTFTQISGREVDVLFVIDGSGSMSDEQNNVARNIDSFLSTAQVFDNDFQIAVTHLDLDETKEYGGQRYEAGELMGQPSFLTRDDNNFSQELSNRVRMGAGGGSREAGLEAAYNALSDPYITDEGSACNGNGDCSEPYNYCTNGTCGGRNAGFIREDASLEIVILSDEEDQSTATPDFYTDFFRSIKGFRNDALLHVSTIIGANVNSNTPADCMSNDGTADAGRRYATVANATGGTVGSICASDFSSFLQNIGNRAFGLRREFFLSRAAEPATVEVRVNGQQQNTGWTYDETTNSVIFERNNVPQPGQEIEVEYEARCF